MIKLKISDKWLKKVGGDAEPANGIYAAGALVKDEDCIMDIQCGGCQMWGWQCTCTDDWEKKNTASEVK